MNLIKIILIFVVAISIQARENPFIATEAYIEEKATIVDKPYLVMTPYQFLEIGLYLEKTTFLIPNHKLFRYFKINEEKKIVLDYKGSKKILTKKLKLDSIHIKSIIIADHPEENYFRIVIQYNDNIKDSKVIYNKNLVTVSNPN